MRVRSSSDDGLWHGREGGSSVGTPGDVPGYAGAGGVGGATTQMHDRCE